MNPPTSDSAQCGAVAGIQPAAEMDAPCSATAESTWSAGHRYAAGNREVAAGVAAVTFIVLAIAGMVRGYSAVPFWDMWNGYLDFYVKACQGNWQAWWGQHNEHRIVLSRILFWLDLACFHGEGWFLLVVNAVLLALISALFVAMWREESGGRATFMCGLLVAWIWSWINHENMTWGFQSQFFLVLFLPLVGFYAISRCVPGVGWREYPFMTACVAGVLAVCSMANGVLALPALAVHAALARLGRSRIVILCCLAATCFAAYFRGYVAPGHHPSAYSTIVGNSDGVFFFLLLYLGSPFYFMAERFGYGLVAGYVSGALMIAASAWTAVRAIRSGRHGSLPLALMVFNGFVVASALATAVGRVGFGPLAAVASRYTLGALMAWAALLVANARPLTRPNIMVSRWLTVGGFGIVAGLLPLQFDALRSRKQELFGRLVAALALELGVNDDRAVRRVWHDSRVALEHVSIPRATDLSIFGWEPIRDAGDGIGKPYGSGEGIPKRLLHGRLDAAERIWADPRFLRIRGRYSLPSGESPPHALAVVKSGVLAGFALVTNATEDETSRDQGGIPEAVFVGYVLQEAAGHGVDLVDAARDSVFSIAVPGLRPWCDVGEACAPEATTVTAAALVPRANQWAGSDFERSRIPRLVVLGSYEKGDADTGAITLRVRKGDSLAFKTGPSADRQRIRLSDHPESTTALPHAPTWTAIRFDADGLRAEFTVEIVDEGKDWGEWSAVALLESDDQQ